MYDDREAKLFAIGAILLILIFFAGLTASLAIGCIFGMAFGLIAVTVLLLFLIVIVLKSAKKVLNETNHTSEDLK